MGENKDEEYPLAKTNGGDQESGDLSTKELKRQKMNKIAKYVVAFLICVLITFIVLVFTLVKSPRVILLTNAHLQTLKTTTNTSSFDKSFSTQIRIKNTNFGPYKFEATTLNFTYGGATVAQVVIPKGKAKTMSTKTINNVIVRLSSTQLPNNVDQDSDELTLGILTLSSSMRMSGKVEVMSIMKKKKSIMVNCAITIDVALNKNVQSLQCSSKKSRKPMVLKPKKIKPKSQPKNKTITKKP
ncbi:hypothetical protein CsatA_011295 [Cannabis sativa]